jgi:hypothetical protein
MHCRLDGFPHRQGTPAEPLAQRLAFEQVRDHAGAAEVGSHIVDHHDIGMGKSGDGSGFLLESAEAVPIGGDVVGEARAFSDSPRATSGTLPPRGR